MVKKILITGKNSYVGTSFIHYCKESNVDFAIDELSVRGNDWKSVDFSKYSAVLHVAGIAHNSSKKKLESLYYSVNRDLTIEVAKKAKKDGVKQFIFMSSIIVFGSQSFANTGITRGTVPNPDNFYGNSKLQAEKALEKLRTTDFNIAILRPPMIYGKRSKGNYRLLSKLSRVTPLFPDYPNIRSVLYIENLCELLYLIVKSNQSDLFLPQNQSYVRTSDIVGEVSKQYQHTVHFTKFFNLIIGIMKRFNIINKVFGDLYYNQESSQISFGDYQIYDLSESILRTEE